MNDVIEQQLISLLQPLLSVPLKKRDDLPEEEDFADLKITSVSVKGMGNEVAQEVDDQGNLINYIPHQAEIAIRCFGAGSLSHLSALLNKLRCTSASEQFQRANIGIGRVENIKTIADVESKGELNADAKLTFFIHYTVAINDAVSVIEHIQAAHTGG